MEDRYEKFYKDNWEKNYGFWHKIITRGEHQVKILKEIINKIEKQKISILDVGCGKGDEVHKALSNIKNKRFSITANDTSQEALNLYEKNNSKNIKTTIGGRLEELPSKINKKFDIILFSHCLYSIGLNGLFSNYIKLLADGGLILIFLDSKKSGVKKVQQKFWRAVHNKDFDENTAEDIIKELSSKNIKYELKVFSNYFDFNKLYSIDKQGINNLLIPFSLRTHEIKEKTIEKINLYIKKLEKDGKMENETFALIIRK